MKILVVRFSSIGDIVLTSPVIRAVSEQLDDVQIHFLTKTTYRILVENNKRIDKVITIDKSIAEVIDQLKKEEYDWVIDLHNNIRTKSLKAKLKRPYRTFKKLNIGKWLLVNLKINRLPELHVVDRYFEAVQHLGVKSDGLRGEFFISAENVVDIHSDYQVEPKHFLTVAVGAKFNTKQLPVSKLIQVLNGSKLPVVLVGGKEDFAKGEELKHLSDAVIINTCGKLNLQQSASVVKQSAGILTNDTGMMHIASCFDVPIVSVWGNTVPDFGMYPYRPEAPESYSIHEVKGLSCRPCSKIGYEKCPKGHFKCMLNQDTVAIKKDLFKD